MWRVATAKKRFANAESLGRLDGLARHTRRIVVGFVLYAGEWVFFWFCIL